MLPSRQRFFRGLALFLAAYTLVASGRALVPGLCASLAAVQDGQVPKIHACCMIGGGKVEHETQVGATPKDHPRCALCEVAKGLLKSAIAAEVPGAPVAPEGPLVLASIEPTLVHVGNASRPRDPPSTVR